MIRKKKKFSMKNQWFLRKIEENIVKNSEIASIKTSFNLKKIIYSEGSFFCDVEEPKVGTHPGGDPPRWDPPRWGPT